MKNGSKNKSVAFIFLFSVVLPILADACMGSPRPLLSTIVLWGLCLTLPRVMWPAACEIPGAFGVEPSSATLTVNHVFQ